MPQVSDKALAHPEARTALKSVLRAWLPLSEAVLGMVVEHLPNPRQACCWRTRVPRVYLWHGQAGLGWFCVRFCMEDRQTILSNDTPPAGVKLDITRY